MPQFLFFFVNYNLLSIEYRFLYIILIVFCNNLNATSLVLNIFVFLCKGTRAIFFPFNFLPFFFFNIPIQLRENCRNSQNCEFFIRAGS